MVPRHLPGPRIQRCCHISPCQRGSPPSPALPPHLLLGKPRQCRQHQFWPGAPSYTALAPSPSPGDRSAPPGSRPAERIYLHISTFVPCQRPISALGETKGLGGARAPAPTPTQLRRPQVPELVRTAARAPRIAAPGPGPGPPPTSALLPLLGQAPKARTKRLSGNLRRSRIYVQLPATTGSKMVCGGFACSKNCLCALNLLYTVSIPSPCLPAWGFCTCLGALWLPCLTSDSLVASRAPFPASHALRAPGLTIRPRRGPGAGACRSLFLSFIVKPPSFRLAGRVSATLLHPAPSPTALFFKHLTGPPRFPTPNPSAARFWHPNASGPGVEARERSGLADNFAEWRDLKLTRRHMAGVPLG